MAQNSVETKRRPPGRPFVKGVASNPGGRPKLAPEIKEMREAVLTKAVAILHAKIHDSKYVAKLRPMELEGFLSMAFDRCGLPKVTRSELTGEDGSPLSVRLVSYADSEKMGGSGA